MGREGGGRGSQEDFHCLALTCSQNTTDTRIKRKNTSKTCVPEVSKHTHLHDDEVGGARVLLQQLVESDLAVRLRSRNIVTSAFRKNSNTEEGEHPTVTRNFREDYIYWQKQKGAL